MSHRQEQAESLIKRAISGILLRKVSDPRIRGLVSVTRIDLSPNFREATVFITVIPDKYASRTIHGLNSGTGMFQSELSKVINLKSVPKLRFRLDEGLKRDEVIFDAIQRGLDREGLTPKDVADHPELLSNDEGDTPHDDPTGEPSSTHTENLTRE